MSCSSGWCSGGSWTGGRSGAAGGRHDGSSGGSWPSSSSSSGGGGRHGRCCSFRCSRCCSYKQMIYMQQSACPAIMIIAETIDTTIILTTIFFKFQNIATV